jgi:hypothetical protein
MRSRDVVQLFNTVGVGARVEVVPQSLAATVASATAARADLVH